MFIILKSGIFFVVLLALSFGVLNADEVHDHGTSNDHGQAMMQNHTENQAHGHSEEDVHHRHDKWIDPPAKYADKESHLWADLDAIQRG